MPFSIYEQEPNFVSLINPQENVLLNISADEALEIIKSGHIERIRRIDGSFAMVTKNGQRVHLARSIGRPIRYFMAKRAAGPMLIVAERIDEIAEFLKSRDLQDQFRPEYTRMAPAHYLTKLDVVGCPDPNPEYERFFTPERNKLPCEIGLPSTPAEQSIWIPLVSAQS